MKGDEGVQTVEERAKLSLLFQPRIRNLQFHNLVFRDVESRYSLGQQSQITSYVLGSKHIGEVSRIKAAVLPVTKAKTVQVNIWLVRKPN